MPVIKADAYGHNAVYTAQQLESDARAFAVALVEEGVALRQAGIDTLITVLEGALTREALIACSEFGLHPVIHCQHQIDLYASLPANLRTPCWIKYDIGMHRLGFAPNQIDQAWQTLCDLSPEQPVLCGHFSCADDKSSASTEQQMSRFMQRYQAFNCRASLANSPAILDWPQSHVDWNRAGIALYGISASTLDKRPKQLLPAMTLKAPVIATRHIEAGESVGYGGTWVAQKPSCIATLAIGYADGYPRHAPSGTPVWINGMIAPLVGRVSMDMITIDVTQVGQVNIGDEVELWGKQLAVETIAAACNTIAYELVTRIGPRVPRHLT